MAVLTLDLEVCYREAFRELQAALSGTCEVLLAHMDDPPSAAFVRLHAPVAGPPTTGVTDHDVRGLMFRAMAQVPAADLDADGYALLELAELASAGLAGKRLTATGHRLAFRRGLVTPTPSGDELLTMRTASIDWTATAERNA